MSAATLRRADFCFTDLETAIPSPLAKAPTRERCFVAPLKRGS
jgi:hypothetical protein